MQAAAGVSRALAPCGSARPARQQQAAFRCGAGACTLPLHRPLAACRAPRAPGRPSNTHCRSPAAGPRPRPCAAAHRPPASSSRWAGSPNARPGCAPPLAAGTAAAALARCLPGAPGEPAPLASRNSPSPLPLQAQRRVARPAVSVTAQQAGTAVKEEYYEVRGCWAAAVGVIQLVGAGREGAASAQQAHPRACILPAKEAGLAS